MNVASNRINERIASFDRAAKDAEYAAAIFSAFFKRLRDDGMDYALASELTLRYAERLWGNSSGKK